MYINACVVEVTQMDRCPCDLNCLLSTLPFGGGGPMVSVEYTAQEGGI